MNKFLFLSIMMILFLVTGCETTKKVGNTAGQVVGEGTNIAGSVTEGGAEAVQGKIRKEENPYGR